MFLVLSGHQQEQTHLTITWPIFGSEIAFTTLENFRESIPFILLGNIASSLKFELISRKIGLVFFRDGTWYAWTFSLPSTWLQIPWWKIVRCFKSGLHCTRLYIAFKAQKLLEVSEDLHVHSNQTFYVHNHVSQKAKGEISNWDAIANRETTPWL